MLEDASNECIMGIKNVVGERKMDDWNAFNYIHDVQENCNFCLVQLILFQMLKISYKPTVYS